MKRGPCTECGGRIGIEHEDKRDARDGRIVHTYTEVCFECGRLPSGAETHYRKPRVTSAALAILALICTAFAVR